MISKPEKALNIPMQEKQSIHVAQFTSDRAQDVLVELGVADGVQVALNGEECIVAHVCGWDTPDQ